MKQAPNNVPCISEQVLRNVQHNSQECEERASNLEYVTEAFNYL